ncbi:MAG: aminotransferase class I/II-fold pyridoxal phosphate-dependent enzyme [Pseudomonas aeruginosa]|nr:aminotransferase class I/II-fold pyridoxal phosphate-dependent enzyme [Pseudomonas aeruginosa]
MQQAAALCGRYDYDAQDALVGLFAKQNGIPAESVHAYCGSRQPLQYAVAAFTGKERSLVMADPSYDSVLGAAQAQGAKVAAVPLDAEAAHDIERMLAAAQRDAGLIYICNPNNPTGTLTPHERIVRAIERKPERSVVLDGELWQLDARIFRWKGLAALIGLAPGYRLDALSGRFLALEQQSRGRRLGLSQSPLGVDLWRWLRAGEHDLFLFEPLAGRVTFLPMADKAVFAVNYGVAGLLAEPMNLAAEEALRDWR